MFEKQFVKPALLSVAHQTSDSLRVEKKETGELEDNLALRGGVELGFNDALSEIESKEAEFFK